MAWSHMLFVREPGDGRNYFDNCESTRLFYSFKATKLPMLQVPAEHGRQEGATDKTSSFSKKDKEFMKNNDIKT